MKNRDPDGIVTRLPVRILASADRFNGLARIDQGAPTEPKQKGTVQLHKMMGHAVGTSSRPLALGKVARAVAAPQTSATDRACGWLLEAGEPVYGRSRAAAAGIVLAVTALSWRGTVERLHAANDDEPILSHAAKLIIAVMVFAFGVLAGAANAVWVVVRSSHGGSPSQFTRTEHGCQHFGKASLAARRRLTRASYGPSAPDAPQAVKRMHGLRTSRTGASGAKRQSRACTSEYGSRAGGRASGC